MGDPSDPEPEIVGRSYRFAVSVSVFYRLQVTQPGAHPGYTHLRQVVRSAGSIGANIEEAQGGQSRADFTSKMTIALKEARETAYWLRILRDSGSWLPLEKRGVAELSQWLNPKTQGEGHVLDWLIREAIELRRVLGAIVMSARRNTKEMKNEL